VDALGGGFTDAHTVAEVLAGVIQKINGLDRSRLLLFGGWESASRGAGVTLQLIGERLGIVDQFQGVDQVTVQADGTFEVLERIEGGRHQVSVCAGAPVLLGWATGHLPEPRNSPQVGMVNMRTVMPALQKAEAVKLASGSLHYRGVRAPQQQRPTRLVKGTPAEEIAKEIVEWLGAVGQG
jgi:electron transfer flavoprotein beta subunit